MRKRFETPWTSIITGLSSKPARGTGAVTGAGSGSRAARDIDGRIGRLMPPVVALTLLAAVLRIELARQSLFADELSTYWIVAQHGLGDVVSIVHTNAEITPPLFFVLSWLGAQVSHAPEWIRSPSVIAGVATVPLVWALGRRTVGKHAALVAAALVTLSPFMQYYGSEARGYALAMALVVLSTLAMLLAVDGGRRRWWVVSALASAGAMYSHYTVAFALVAQLAWVLWAYPEARKAALLANVGAAVLFLPWLSGLRNDLNSPTQDILSALSPFTAHDVRIALERWVIGYPYVRLPLADVPGVVGLVLVGLGLLAGLVGLVLRHRPTLDRRVLLVALLAVS